MERYPAKVRDTEILAITEKINQALENFDLMYGEKHGDEYIQDVYDQVDNLDSGELKFHLKGFLNRYQEMTNAMSEVSEERDEVLASVADWFCGVNMDVMSEEIIPVVAEADEQASEYQSTLKEGFTMTRFGFDKLKQLAEEIGWADRHGYSAKLLEEEKKALEKTVIHRFKDYSGMKKKQESKRVSVSRHQAQMVQVRNTAADEIKDILGALKDPDLELKFKDFLRMNEKQDRLSEAMSKQLAESKEMEKQWKEENVTMAKQKARLTEVNNKLRGELRRVKEALSMYRLAPSGSQSEDSEMDRVDSSDDPHARSLLQLKRAREALLAIEAENREIADMPREKRKPKTPPERKITPEGSEGSLSDGEGSKHQNPPISHSQFKIHETELKNVTKMKDELMDEAKVLMKEIKSLDDTIETMEADNTELRKQMQEASTYIDQRKLYFDGKMRKKNGRNSKKKSKEALQKPKIKTFVKSSNTPADWATPQQGEGGCTCTCHKDETNKENETPLSRKGSAQSPAMPKSWQDGEEVVPKEEVEQELKWRDKLIDQLNVQCGELEVQVEQLEGTVAAAALATGGDAGDAGGSASAKSSAAMLEVHKKLSKGSEETDAETDDSAGIIKVVRTKRSGTKWKKKKKSAEHRPGSKSKPKSAGKSSSDEEDLKAQPEELCVPSTIIEPQSQPVLLKPELVDFGVQTVAPTPPPTPHSQTVVPTPPPTPHSPIKKSPSPALSKRQSLKELDLDFNNDDYQKQSIGIHMMTGANPADVRKESMKCSKHLNAQLQKIVTAVHSFVYNTKCLIDQEVKHMLVANDRLLIKVSDAEKTDIKNRMRREANTGDEAFNAAIQYTMEHLDGMVEKMKDYIGGMGDGAIKTVEDIFSVFHSGLYIQNGQYEVLHSLVEGKYTFFSYEAATDDKVFLTEVKSPKLDMGRLASGSIPSFRSSYNSPPIEPKDDPEKIHLPKMHSVATSPHTCTPPPKSDSDRPESVRSSTGASSQSSVELPKEKPGTPPEKALRKKRSDKMMKKLIRKLSKTSNEDTKPATSKPTATVLPTQKDSWRKLREEYQGPRPTPQPTCTPPRKDSIESLETCNLESHKIWLDKFRTDYAEEIIRDMSEKDIAAEVPHPKPQTVKQKQTMGPQERLQHNLGQMLQIGGFGGHEEIDSGPKYYVLRKNDKFDGHRMSNKAVMSNLLNRQPNYTMNARHFGVSFEAAKRHYGRKPAHVTTTKRGPTAFGMVDGGARTGTQSYSGGGGMRRKLSHKQWVKNMLKTKEDQYMKAAPKTTTEVLTKFHLPADYFSGYSFHEMDTSAEELSEMTKEQHHESMMTQLVNARMFGQKTQKNIKGQFLPPLGAAGQNVLFLSGKAVK